MTPGASQIVSEVFATPGFGAAQQSEDKDAQRNGRQREEKGVIPGEGSNDTSNRREDSGTDAQSSRVQSHSLGTLPPREEVTNDGAADGDQARLAHTLNHAESEEGAEVAGEGTGPTGEAKKEEARSQDPSSAKSIRQNSHERRQYCAGQACRGEKKPDGLRRYLQGHYYLGKGRSDR